MRVIQHLIYEVEFYMTRLGIFVIAEGTEKPSKV